MYKERNRSYRWSAFTLLLIASMLLVPTGSVYAQEGAVASGNDAVPALVTDLYELDYAPYVYMDEVSRLMQLRDVSKSPAEVVHVVASTSPLTTGTDSDNLSGTTVIAELPDNPLYPDVYMEELTRVLRQRAGLDSPIEPDAGSWTPWLLESVDDVFPVRPPNARATRAEIEELKTLAAARDEAALAQIAWWNAGPPPYRWNQIAMDSILKRALPANLAFRDLALMHAAIYDATIAAWNAKYAYNRVRPSEFDSTLETAIANPDSPAYPSEYAAAAGAAVAVLSYIFPEDAEHFASLAQQSTDSRLLAGVEYPSDIAAGLAIGQQIGDLAVAHGMADGSDLPWTGTVPTEEGKWSGENPAFPTNGDWSTWVLESGDQFRPGPPPAFDSEEMATEMQELRDFERTPVTNSKAQFWEYGSGGRRIHWNWNTILDRLVLEAGYAHNAPRAARAYALTNIAGHDSIVACWDAKYTYWAIRPFQLDPEFTTTFPTPSHPAYPSAHSCISISAAEVMAELFPMAAAELQSLTADSTESRIWSGIHFRSDVTAGIQLGYDVATAVLTHAAADGSQ